MSPGRRQALAVVMFVVSSVALVATTPAQYEPDISDQLIQELELSGDQPVAATTVRLLVSAQALAGMGESGEADIRIVATAPEAAGGLTPEFRVTATAAESEAYNDGSNPETVSWRNLAQLCPTQPCDAALEITVEWLNAVPGEAQAVVLTVDAGIDYRSGSEGEAPDGARIALEIDEELALLEASPMLRAQTEPETVTLSADAPFALRHIVVDIAADAIPTDVHAEEDRSAIFAVSGIDNEELAIASVWPDPDQAGHGGGRPGSVLPIWCEPGFDCQVGYTLTLLWNGREPDDVATVTWGFTSVLRYTDRAVAPPREQMRASVDRAVDTGGDDRDRLEVEVGGSIERAPGDPFISAPAEPAEGPHLIGVTIPTWQPVPEGSNTAVPTTGVMTLSARSADGSDLIGPVTVSVVAHHPVVKWGPPRNHELTPAAPDLIFAVLPSMRCNDPDLEEPVADGRCTVPFDIYVGPPDEATGPVVVEWSLRLQAVAPDGVTLEPGDLRVGPTR